MTALWYLRAMGNNLERAINYYFSTDGRAHLEQVVVPQGSGAATQDGGGEDEDDAVVGEGGARKSTKASQWTEAERKEWKASLLKALRKVRADAAKEHRTYSLSAVLPDDSLRRLSETIDAPNRPTLRDFRVIVPAASRRMCGVELFECVWNFRRDNVKGGASLVGPEVARAIEELQKERVAGPAHSVKQEKDEDVGEAVESTPASRSAARASATLAPATKPAAAAATPPPKVSAKKSSNSSSQPAKKASRQESPPPPPAAVKETPAGSKSKAAVGKKTSSSAEPPKKVLRQEKPSAKPSGKKAPAGKPSKKKVQDDASTDDKSATSGDDDADEETSDEDSSEEDSDSSSSSDSDASSLFRPARGAARGGRGRGRGRGTAAAPKAKGKVSSSPKSSSSAEEEKSDEDDSSSSSPEASSDSSNRPRGRGRGRGVSAATTSKRPRQDPKKVELVEDRGSEDDTKFSLSRSSANLKQRTLTGEDASPGGIMRPSRGKLPDDAHKNVPLATILKDVLEHIKDIKALHMSSIVKERVPTGLIVEKNRKPISKLYDEDVSFGCIPKDLWKHITNSNMLAALLKLCCSQCQNIQLSNAAAGSFVELQIQLGMATARSLQDDHNDDLSSSSSSYCSSDDDTFKAYRDSRIIQRQIQLSLKISDSKVVKKEKRTFTPCACRTHALICTVISGQSYFNSKKKETVQANLQVTACIPRHIGGGSAGGEKRVQKNKKAEKQKESEVLKQRIVICFNSYPNKGVANDPIADILRQETLYALFHLADASFTESDLDDESYPHFRPAKFAEVCRKASAAKTFVDLVDKLAVETGDTTRAREPTPKGIAMKLMPHQEEDLAFMLNAEREGCCDYLTCKTRQYDAAQPYFILFCPLTRDFCVTKLDPKKDAACLEVINPTIHGGFLCDVMGLGKTLVITALITKNPPSPSTLKGTVSVPFQSQWDLLTLRPDLGTKAQQWPPKKSRFSYGLEESSSGEDEGDDKQNLSADGNMFICNHNGPVRTTIEQRYANLPKAVVNEYHSRHVLVPLGATLIVAPVSICGQWVSELSRGNPRLRIILYHGMNRANFTLNDFRQADVIVTTYETLASQVQREQCVSQLFARAAPHQNQISRWLDSVKECLNSKKERRVRAETAKSLFPKFGLEDDELLKAVEFVTATLRDYFPTSFTRFHFHRIVLDESQKCSDTQTSSLGNLHSTYRWLCTGTPLQNNLSSINNLFKFLGNKSLFANKNFIQDSNLSSTDGLSLSYFRKFMSPIAEVIRRPLSMKEARKVQLRFPTSTKVRRAFPILFESCFSTKTWAVAFCLQKYMIRHIKTAEIESSINVPEKTIVPICVTMSPDEKKIYEWLAERIRREYEVLQRQHRLTHRIGRVQMWMEMLLRVATHVKLVQEQALSLNAEGTAGVANENAKHNFELIEPAKLLAMLEQLMSAGKKIPDNTTIVVAKLNEHPPEIEECSICMDTMNQPTMLTCYHLFCRECVLGSIAVGLECPHCRARSLGNKKLQVKLDMAELAPESAPEFADMLELAKKSGDGSKVVAILKILQDAWAVDPHVKFVIFSRFNGFIDLLHKHFTNRVKHCVIDGSTTLSKRSSLIAEFQHPLSELTVCIVSSRAGNAGLTLTAASQLILCEPNLNSVVEEQAMGRVHRFGQTKRVTIYRVYMAGTIEEKVFKLASENKLAGQGGAGENAHENQLRTLLLDR